MDLRTSPTLLPSPQGASRALIQLFIGLDLDFLNERIGPGVAGISQNVMLSLAQ
jgi:hypothetical protein